MTQNLITEDIRQNEKVIGLTVQLHGLACPKCNSRNYSKNGKAKGNQRYRCCRCGKHFRSTTGNSIHHLHLKSKIQAYIECMNKGLSLRKTAEMINISLRTAFRWRHRFLSAMRKHPGAVMHENQVISAYTLPYSDKGKPKQEHKPSKITSIIRLDVSGRASINVLGRYGCTLSKISETLHGHSAHIVSKSMPKALKTASGRCATEEQLQCTKETNEEIGAWFSKMRGVATRYLENYWRWFSLMRQLQSRTSEPVAYMYACF